MRHTLIIVLAMLALTAGAETNDIGSITNVAWCLEGPYMSNDLDTVSWACVASAETYTITLDGYSDAPFKLTFDTDGTNSVTKLVKQLAAEGRICEVFGHQWRRGRPGEGYDPESGRGISTFCDYHPGTWYRTCAICGKCENQSINDWK